MDCSLPHFFTPPHISWAMRNAQVITSADFAGAADTILLLASTTLAQAKGGDAQQMVLSIPKIHAYFTGTGTHSLCR